MMRQRMFAAHADRTSRCPLGGRRRSSRNRAGLTFTEILFAIMLLGIGFIMVAAIFPVAIQQSQANLQDTVGVSVAQSGARLCQAMGFTWDELSAQIDFDTSSDGYSPSHPHRADSRMHMFDDGKPNTNEPKRYQHIKNNLIVQSDPRFAFVPVGYKMPLTPSGQQADYAEVFVVAVQSRIRPVYDEGDVDGWTFTPKRVNFYLTEGGLTDPDRITFTAGDKDLTPRDEPAAAEGAFVFVADDQTASRARNGRFYRIGPRVEGSAGTWELLPGKDMSLEAGTDGVFGTNDDVTENLPPRGLGVAPSAGAKPARGLMIGRGYPDPAKTDAVDGPAQDLYATTVTVFFQQ